MATKDQNVARVAQMEAARREQRGTTAGQRFDAKQPNVPAAEESVAKTETGMSDLVDTVAKEPKSKKKAKKKHRRG